MRGKKTVETTRGDVFRENLQSYMTEERISHNSIAKASGVSQKTIWSVCSGRSVPSLDTAENVANGVGVDAAVLQIKPLSPSQVGRSKKVARLMSEVIELSADELRAVSVFVSGMRQPKAKLRVKQYALLSEPEDQED